MCFVCDVSCDVAWVDFVFVCVLCVCVMLRGLISLFFVGGGCVCACFEYVCALYVRHGCSLLFVCVRICA